MSPPISNCHSREGFGIQTGIPLLDPSRFSV
uniref:Uncharacterized protein n=1 Tax=Anguilla anguilla TaxID=7936 RepID=A0A0E9WK53_ANGAN